jgi:hypothetical protein
MSELLTEFCQLAVRLTNDFKRPISVYRSAGNEVYHLYAYLESNHRWISIDTGDSNRSRGKRGLYLYPDSQQFKFDFTKNRPHKEFANRIFPAKENVYYGPDLIRGTPAFKIISLFSEWLGSPGLMRVDPYDIWRVLDSEETEIDLILAGNVAMIERFEEGLKAVELKPGIITPGEAPRINN